MLVVIVMCGLIRIDLCWPSIHCVVSCIALSLSLFFF